MIVTADASGDFNATSQILRYSALAREITVPRIPSVTSTILSHSVLNRPGSSGSSSQGSGASTPPSSEHLAELTRLSDEVAVLTLQLEDECMRREAAERGWAVSEERVDVMEQEIRDECWAEMEVVMERERMRWRGAWEGEAERGEDRIDKKIEILARGTMNEEDNEDPKDTKTEEKEKEFQELVDENARLRARIELLEREKLLKTPSVGKKQRALKSRKWEEVDLDDSP
jgi:hypothetical protein